MILSAIYKSIVKDTVDLIATIKVATGDQTIEYHAWETRADENLLPKVTLIGVDGFQFDENEGLWVTRYAIAVSTYRDANLLKEIEILDLVHDRTGEGKTLELVDPDTGAPLSTMVTSAWRLSPMGNSEYRNYRVISRELLRTGTI